MPASVRGFTLLELLVVLAIMALATAGVSLALPEPGHTSLVREGERLAALLDGARAQARASGTAVLWRRTAHGFRFEGLPDSAADHAWLDPATQALTAQPLVLGPDPIIAAQSVLLTRSDTPGARLAVATDGLRPFQVGALP